MPPIKNEDGDCETTLIMEKGYNSNNSYQDIKSTSGVLELEILTTKLYYLSSTGIG